MYVLVFFTFFLYRLYLEVTLLRTKDDPYIHFKLKNGLRFHKFLPEEYVETSK